MGDRWRPSLLGSSRYIWFPLSWSTGIPQIVHTDIWSIDLSSGTYTAAVGVSYEAEGGTISERKNPNSVTQGLSGERSLLILLDQLGKDRLSRSEKRVPRGYMVASRQTMQLS